VFVINGFTPHQLSTYAGPHIAIVVFVLTGNASWREMRTHFIGKSDPKEAAPGSIRKELYENRTALGIRNLSLAANGAHLSAGPVEALVELRRFTSDFLYGKRRPIEDMQFGRKLALNFTREEIDRILENPAIEVNGLRRSIFDLTEEKDEQIAIELLSSLHEQISSLSAPVSNFLGRNSIEALNRIQ
jgi:hypothetical protein